MDYQLPTRYIMADKNLQKMRVFNLKQLLKKEASITAFAAKLGCDKSQVSRLISNPDKHPLTNTMAKRIEAAGCKPFGWLDLDHAKNPDVGKIPIELCIESFLGVVDFLREVDIEVTRLDRAALHKMLEQTLISASAYDSVDMAQIKESLLTSILNTLTH
jgi:hypothetical protein